MVKHKEQYDDDIDFLELFLIFWKYKITLASLTVIGLILGLAFTYEQVPRYKTEFNVIVGHPAYNDSLLLSSPDIQSLFSQAQLNPAKMPRVTMHKKKTNTITFQVESFNPDEHEEIRMRFKGFIAKELELQKSFALIKTAKDSYNKSNLIILNERSQFIGSLLTSEIIAEIPVDDILREFQVIFGGTKTVQPNPRRYGIFGMFAGLLLAGCWIGLSLLYQAIQKKYSLKR
jgi:hypothetical protein